MLSTHEHGDTEPSWLRTDDFVETGPDAANDTDVADGEDDFEEVIIPTQQCQTPTYVPDLKLWGVLEHFTGREELDISFERDQRKYRLGRTPPHIDPLKPQGYHFIELRNNKTISGLHCEIEWQVPGPKSEEGTPSILITDRSTNGTFINKRRMKRGECALLHDGNEVAFGTWETGNSDHDEDADARIYRYTFRAIAAWTQDDRELFQKYQLHLQLGRGQFGSVLLALCKDAEHDRRWCAVKIIPHQDVSRTGWREMVAEKNEHGTSILPAEVAREVAIMKQLTRHPHICELLDFFSEDYGLALVLELMAGGDLRAYMENTKEKKPIGENKAIYFTYQICDALAHLHAHGIAHRDVKPANVLLTDSDPPRAKIADFGLSKEVDAAMFVKTQTMCGTPIYTAPEVFEKARKGQAKAKGEAKGYDVPRVDSWSVGVMVSEMVIKQLPFRHSTGRGHRIWWSLFRDMNEDGQQFLQGLLQEDPKNRFDMVTAREHGWLTVGRSLMAQDDIDALRAFFHAEVHWKPPAPQEHCDDDDSGNDSAYRSWLECLTDMDYSASTTDSESDYVSSRVRRRSPSPADPSSDTSTRRARKRARLSYSNATSEAGTSRPSIDSEGWEALAASCSDDRSARTDTESADVAYWARDSAEGRPRGCGEEEGDEAEEDEQAGRSSR